MKARLGYFLKTAPWQRKVNAVLRITLLTAAVAFLALSVGSPLVLVAVTYALVLFDDLVYAPGGRKYHRVAVVVHSSVLIALLLLLTR